MRRCWAAVVVLACAAPGATGQPSPVIGQPVEVPAAVEGPISEPVRPRDEPPKPKREDFGIGGFGGFGAGGGTGAPGYNAAYYPTRPVSGQNTDLSLFRQNLSLGVPVWRDGTDTLLLTGGVRNTIFSTDARLPDSGRPFPDALWNVTAGLQYLHKFENGWTAGGGFSVGSASDKPFNSLREMIANVNAFVRIPTFNERDAVLLGVFYSPAGNLNFPVPALAYIWNPTERFRMSIGLPFSITWRPTDDLTFAMSYVPVVNLNARVTYRVVEDVFVYGAFEWLNEAYFLAGRADRQDRFLVFEKRLVGGVRWDFWKHGALEVNAGYAFDRDFGVSRNTISNLRDRVDVSPGAFLGASFRLRF
jgi:hypothetical protein